MAQSVESEYEEEYLFSPQKVNHGNIVFQLFRFYMIFKFTKNVLRDVDTCDLIKN